MVDKKYDFDKVIKMCLCHDLGESLIGDITPRDKSYKDKDEMEKMAVEQIAKEGNFSELALLFKEYQENKTPEAQLANDLDKLDMYAQAIDYEHRYPNKDLDEFKQSAMQNIQTELGMAILKDFSSM